MKEIETATVEVNGKTVEYLSVSPVGAICPACGSGRGVGCKNLPVGEHHPEALKAATDATARRGERLREDIERHPNATFSIVVRVY